MHYFFRKFILLTSTASICFISSCKTSDANNVQQENTAQEKLAALEKKAGGKIGVSALNIADNRHIQYRADEHFALCSTSKLMVVAAILKKSETDPALLQAHLNYTQKDIDAAGYTPITKQHLAAGMNIEELCKAAIEYSDSLAMTLLIKNLGGLAAVTKFARTIDDNAFRLDRWEPELNTAIPDDVRDTTTPAAMEKSLKYLSLGNALAPPQQEQLLTFVTSSPD